MLTPREWVGNDGVQVAVAKKWQLKLTMKIGLTVLTGIAALGFFQQISRAIESDGLALAIIYDTSGSMRETVPDKDGRPAAKYLIANRALAAIARQIAAFGSNSASGPRRIDAGLFVFESPGAREAIKFGPFDSAAFENWAKGFSSPVGGTPLGNALNLAGQTVLRSPLSRKHVLVITDGISNTGPPPASVMPRLKQQAEKQGADLGVHFVAFDVAAKVFEPVKKLGATVVGAANELQLNNQLEYILQKKILLEEEEPAKK